MLHFFKVNNDWLSSQLPNALTKVELQKASLYKRIANFDIEKKKYEVFCCIHRVRIHPDNSGCQQDFLSSKIKFVDNVMSCLRKQILEYSRGNGFEKIIEIV